MRGSWPTYLRGPCVGEGGMRGAWGEAEGRQRASRASSHSGGPQQRRRGEGRPSTSVLAVLRALICLVLR